MRERREPSRMGGDRRHALEGVPSGAEHEREADPLTAALELFERALLLPERPRSRWHRGGMSPRGERVFNVVATLVLLVFITGWSWSLATGRAWADDRGVSRTTARITAALTTRDAPTAAFLTQAALDVVQSMRGHSGRLEATVVAPEDVLLQGNLPEGVALQVDAQSANGAGQETAATSDSAAGEPWPAFGSSGTAADITVPGEPGVWRMVLRAGEFIRPLADFRLITMRPLSDKQRGRIGLYYIGQWPGEGSSAPARPGYAPPRGVIEVTPENQDTYVSRHFRLRDFLTKGQENVWPKYLVLDMRLVDKLELVLADLESRGIDPRGVKVMSGFRTPQYNVSGGDPTGRAALSRHMYGDAADIFIDNSGNTRMDDLNGDGRVNLADVQVIVEAVERVERAYPELVGGIGVYGAASGHGPFIHIDTRGFRSRWTSTGNQ